MAAWQNVVGIVFLLLVGVLFVASLDSSEVDDLCEEDGSILLREDGVWACGDLPNATAAEEIDPLSVHRNGTVEMTGDWDVGSYDVNFSGGVYLNVTYRGSRCTYVNGSGWEVSIDPCDI